MRSAFLLTVSTLVALLVAAPADAQMRVTIAGEWEDSQGGTMVFTQTAPNTFEGHRGQPQQGECGDPNVRVTGSGTQYSGKAAFYSSGDCAFEGDGTITITLAPDGQSGNWHAEPPPDSPCCAASGTYRRPRIPESNCSKAEYSRQVGRIAYGETATLAGVAGAIYGVDVVLPAIEERQVLRGMERALPSPQDLPAHVDSHADRHKEEGAWKRTSGNAAQRRADAQRQVDEVMKNKNRRIRSFVNSKGLTRYDVYIPPSPEHPKGKMIRFKVENGRLKHASLGVPKPNPVERTVQATVLTPVAVTLLLAAGFTATASGTAQIIAAIQQRLCDEERARQGGARASAAANVRVRMRRLPRIRAGFGVSGALARSTNALLRNMAAQAAYGDALRRVTDLAQARRLATRLASLLGAEPRLRAAVARTREMRATITIPPFTPTPEDEALRLRTLVPALRRLRAPADAAELARIGYAAVAAVGVQTALGDALVQPGMDEQDRDAAAALRTFAGGG